MIFVTTGSRDYQFNRLINKIDELVGSGIITDHVVAQIGDSNEPKNIEWYRFLDVQQFNKYQNDATLIISHAGTGALISAIRKGKNVISVPRLARFGEHIDDHQTQISRVLEQSGYLREVLDISQLEQVIKTAIEKPIDKKYDRPSNVLRIIMNYLDNIERCMHL